MDYDIHELLAAIYVDTPSYPYQEELGVATIARHDAVGLGHRCVWPDQVPHTLERCSIHKHTNAADNVDKQERYQHEDKIL